ncbi:MAG: hypothetical protein R3F56_04130 [Planctomycetota bacterium]
MNSWRRRAAVFVLVVPLSGQAETRVSSCLADLEVAAKRDEAVDTLIALGRDAAPGVVAKLAALDDPDEAPEVTTSLLVVLGSLERHAAMAAPVILPVLAHTRREDVFTLAWWALGETQRVRSVLPAGDLATVLATADVVTKSVADAKLELARQVAVDPGALRRALRCEDLQAYQELGWARAPAAAALVADAASGAPDLASMLGAHFDALFARRRSLEAWETWCLGEITMGMRRLALAPDDELRVEVARLRHPIARERRLAAIELRRFGGRAAPFLGDLLARLDDPDAGVQCATIATVGELGVTGLPLRPRLQHLVQADDPRVAGAASTAVARLEEVLRHASERVAAAVAFVAADDAARAEAKATLAVPPDVATILLAALAAESHEAVQLDLLDVLGRGGPGGVGRVTVLVELLPNATPDVADAVWSALAAVGPAAAAMKDLRRRIEWGAAAAAAPSLAAMSETLAALLLRTDKPAALRAYLGDGNPILRLRAIEALGRAGELEQASLDALAAAATAVHPQDVRVALPGPQSAARTEFVVDSDSIRVEAARVLLARDPRSPRSQTAVAVALAAEDVDARLDALRWAALQPLPESAVAHAIDCLRDPRDEVALAAVVALGRCGPAAAQALPQLDLLGTGEGALAAAARAAHRAIAAR